VEYRGSDEALAPAYLLDIKTAVRFLKKEAAQYHIDANRVGIWGNSSGAHGSVLTALTNHVEVLAPAEYPEYDAAVQAVIDFYGPSDLSKICDYPRAPFLMALPPEQQSESVVLGGTPAEKHELAELLNPLNYIHPEEKIPPFLIMHGDEDGFVPFNQSVRLYEALRDNGKQVSFFKVKGGLHGDRMWNRKTIGIVLDFLNAYL
jgi:acetyl esterase/lipase